MPGNLRRMLGWRLRVRTACLSNVCRLHTEVHMSARRFSWAFMLRLTGALLLAAPALCRAQNAPADLSAAPSDVESSKFQFIGRITGSAVFVRAGARDVDYPVIKIENGAQVTVVGERFGWLKIVPPEGSFCYVASAFVERHGGGAGG